MGIIQNQSSKSTLYIYMGVVVGFLNSALLFPRYLEVSEKGILDSITSICLISAGIFSLGVPLATIRLFPYFRNKENNHNSYFSFLAIIILLGLILGLIPLYLFYKSEFPELVQSSYYLGLVGTVYFFRLVFNNLDAYIRMQYNSVLGIVSSNLVLKSTSLIGISLFALNIIAFKELVLIFSLALSLPGLISLFYLLYHRNINLKISLFKKKIREEKNLKKELFKTASYGLLGAMGGVFLIEVDKLILLDLLGEKEVGIYSTAAFFGIIVNVPSRALRSIASVVIADSWKRNDLENIQDVYQKSTLNLQIIASYLFIGVVLCSKYVFEFMKPEYSEGISIIIYIAIAQLVDAITSVNTDILTTSKYYKYQTFFMFGMIVMVVSLNYWLIPIYGIEGAAISTMISLITVNLIKTVFIYRKINIQPFFLKNFTVLLLASVVFILSYFFERIIILEGFVQLLVAGTFISLVYWVPVYFLKISPELIEIVKKRIKK